MMQPDTSGSPENESAFSRFILSAGVILAISYPVLALSAGVRAAYQLYEQDPTNSPWLTLLGSIFYLLATIGFVRRQRWAWRLSVGVLLVESAFTLVIGTLSITQPELFGRNVWDYFGRDYGYFPLVQPLLGLAWLFNAQIRRLYFEAS